MSAGSVAAARMRAHRKIRHVFEEADAFSPERAIGYEPQRRMERRVFDRLLADRIVSETGDGRYHGDRQAWDEADSRRRRRMIGMIGASLAAALALFGISQL